MFKTWCMIDVIVIFHFGVFFAVLLAQKMKNLKKWKKHLEISSFHTSVPKIMIIWYIVWEMTSDRCNCYFSFWGIFCPFTCLKNENFTKMKKLLGDIIILHKCTTTHNHMVYCPWDTAGDRCNCNFSFRAIFCPFTSSPSPTPGLNWKNKNFKKSKNLN